MLPPEPISSIFSKSFVLVLIHDSNSLHVSFFTLSFNKRTVPILKDLDSILLELCIIENSVLPPPTSTYKYVLFASINLCKSVAAIIVASSSPSIISICILEVLAISRQKSLPFSASRIAEVAHALYLTTP